MRLPYRLIIALLFVTLIVSNIYTLNKTHKLSSKISSIEQKLADYNIDVQGVTVIRVPNFLTGDIQEYAVTKMIHTAGGNNVPAFIHKSEYEGFYDDLRNQIVMYQEVMEKDRNR